MNQKKALGQFFTTNVDYIFGGFEYLVKDKKVVDPYAGSGELLNWSIKHGAQSVRGYDIDSKYINDIIRLNDSLVNPPLPDDGDFIVTNPPYLAKNKMPQDIKEKYMKHNIDDLYHVSLEKIIESEYKEGLIILPVNFFSSEIANPIRNKFLSIYSVDSVNYFTEQVFQDTTYNVVAFHFYKNKVSKQFLNFNVFPSKDKYSFDVEKEFDFRIGGRDVANIMFTDNVLSIKRLTEDMMNENVGDIEGSGFFNDFYTTKLFNISNDYKYIIEKNIIVVNCIDGKSNNKISAQDIGSSFLVGKNSSRNIAHLIINDIDIDEQRILIKMFNDTLSDLRKKYHSMFLTNFRDNNRKRISFDFCYKLLNYCYKKLHE